MKKILLSLVVASGLLMADQADNKSACEGIKKSFPGMYEAGLDYFEIMSGKKSACEEHTAEEWKNIGFEAYYGHMVELRYSHPLIYSKVIEQVKKGSVKNVVELDKLISEAISKDKLAS